MSDHRDRLFNAISVMDVVTTRSEFDAVMNLIDEYILGMVRHSLAWSTNTFAREIVGQIELTLKFMREGLKWTYDPAIERGDGAPTDSKFEVVAHGPFVVLGFGPTPEGALNDAVKNVEEIVDRLREATK